MAVDSGGCGKVSRDASQMGISVQIPMFIGDVPSTFLKCSSIGIHFPSTLLSISGYFWVFVLSFSIFFYDSLEPFGAWFIRVPSKIKVPTPSQLS
jgi:hypothetical protein